MQISPRVCVHYSTRDDEGKQLQNPSPSKNEHRHCNCGGGVLYYYESEFLKGGTAREKNAKK